MSNCVLGIDLGTSGVKLCLLDERGTVAAYAQAGYPTVCESPGMAEQDTALWEQAISAACAQVFSARPDARGRVVAVGLSAQLPTLVVTDRQGVPLMRAITWRDSRADGVGAALLDAFGRDEHFRITGVRLDGRYLAPMYRYQRERGLLRRDILLLGAKDYLYHRLTGCFATDPGTASGFGLYDLEQGGWHGGLCGTAAIDASMLPPVYASHSAPAELDARGAALLGLERGVPVALGCADSVCGMLAMGVVRAGDAAAIWGTSTALLAPTDAPRTDRENGCFLTPSAFPGTFALEADMLSTGLSFAWLSRLLQKTPEELLLLAAEAPPGSGGVRFYPYLAGGEQGVLWDSALRGSIRGLDAGHGAAHISRALAEGVCFETRRCMDAFRTCGVSLRRLVCSGHLPDSPMFMQLLSDVTGLVCETAADGGSACGAAYLAGIAAGVWDAQTLPVRACLARYEPDDAAAGKYSLLYDAYINLA